MAEQTATYPPPDELFHGRSVWSMGENGEWGVVVEGDDRRAWAALNAWCRDRGPEVVIDLHVLFGGPGPVEQRPRASWMTWRDECGCTDEQHAAHQVRVDADEPGIDICSDITGRSDCSSLLPCTDEVATWIPEFAAEPADGAVSVLVWRFDG